MNATGNYNFGYMLEYCNYWHKKKKLSLGLDYF